MTNVEELVDIFVADLLDTDPLCPEFDAKVEQIMSLGRVEIMDVVCLTNQFLERPLRALAQDNQVGQDLATLKQTIEQFDPSKKKVTKIVKLFGIIPLTKSEEPVDYFGPNSTAHSHIKSILARLETGKQSLVHDNKNIDIERKNLWRSIDRLKIMSSIAQLLDEKVTAVLMSRDLEPSVAANFRDRALFYIRQRSQDILTQIAVSLQGYMALELIKKNNSELIKGVDRTSTTTVSALRTAVTVAQAMTNQRVVSDQITSLNGVAASVITSTSDRIVRDSHDIYEQSISSTIPIETVQKAFSNIYETIELVDGIKRTGIDRMRATVDALRIEMDKSMQYVESQNPEVIPQTLNIDSALNSEAKITRQLR